jgi:transposase
MVNQGRKRKVDGVENRRLSEIARQRAHRTLARLHPEEFHRLLEAERRNVGHVKRPRGRPRLTQRRRAS